MFISHEKLVGKSRALLAFTSENSKIMNAFHSDVNYRTENKQVILSTSYSKTRRNKHSKMKVLK